MWELRSGKKELLESVEMLWSGRRKKKQGLQLCVEEVSSVFNYQMEKESEIRDVTRINF